MKIGSVYDASLHKNIPEVKLGIIAVSRDCFPIGLSCPTEAPWA